MGVCACNELEKDNRIRGRMWKAVRATLGASYVHLVVLFVLVVLLLRAQWMISSDVNLLWFAIVLGILGLTIAPTKRHLGFQSWWVYVAFALALLLRAIPYFTNTVPLGYDPGLHVYAAEHPFGEDWLQEAYPLPFVLFSGAAQWLFGSAFSVSWLFVILSAACVFGVSYCLLRIADKDVAAVGSLLFVVSIAQFETFWYNYYKNVFGILALLLAIVHLPRMHKFDWKLILFGTLVSIAHNPALFLFGLSYFFFMVVARRCTWAALANGAAILGLFVLLNIDRVQAYILPQLYWSAKGLGGGGAGTFFDSYTYLLYMLPFIPFAITGYLRHWKKYELSIPATLALFVVLFGLFFHNRFIIYLDLFVILFAALGIVDVIRARERFAWVLGILFAISFVVITVHALHSKPLLSQEEFERISSFDDVLPANATVLSTDKFYSPWLKGYVHRTVVAPGLFGSSDTEEDWIAFVSAERTTFLKDKPRPLYVFVGEQQPQYDFTDDCFTPVAIGLYEYVCP